MTAISGTIAESHNTADWVVRTYRADTGALLAETAVDTTSSGSYTASCGSYAGAVFATCHPKIGVRWSASAETALDSYAFPTDPSAKPYFFQATTAPSGDASFSSVTLLLHCDGTDGGTAFTDSSGSPKTVTANGGAHVETDQSKFGGASLYTGGADTDYLSLPSDSGLAFPGDFTIELWAYITQSGGYQFILTAAGAADATGWALFVDTTGYFRFLGSAGSSWGFDLTSTTAPALNTWQHLCVARSGSTSKLFVDGVSVGTFNGTAGLSIASGTTIEVGNYPYAPGGRKSCKGYIDDVRITKGVARYTANFTPPASAFPDQAGALTGSTEPTWPTATGNTVTDGNVTWTCKGPLVQPLTQGPLIAS